MKIKSIHGVNYKVWIFCALARVATTIYCYFSLRQLVPPAWYTKTLLYLAIDTFTGMVFGKLIERRSWKEVLTQKYMKYENEIEFEEE